MDLFKILLLGLEGIGREIFKISAYLSFISLEVSVLVVSFLLNWEEIYCLKDIFLLLAINLFQLNLYIANKDLYTANPNFTIYRIYLAILFFNGLCLMNTTILRRKHIIFFISTAKYLSMPNSEIEYKLPSHKCRSVGWLS